MLNLRQIIPALNGSGHQQILQGWGTIPGHVPVLSPNLRLARRCFVHQTPANFPSTRDAGLPTPNHVAAAVGARTLLLGSVALCSRGISDACMNGHQPGAWLIDITGGGHTDATACSLAGCGPVLGELLLRLDPPPGEQRQTVPVRFLPRLREGHLPSSITDFHKTAGNCTGFSISLSIGHLKRAAHPEGP